MGFERGYDEKIDVIDLIINVLKDHEKRMDELISRLEVNPKTERALPYRDYRKTSPSRAAVTVELSKWQDFREKGSTASLVTFDIINKKFYVFALGNGILYSYVEEIPEMEIKYNKLEKNVQIESINISTTDLMQVALTGKLECGLGLLKREYDIEINNEISMRKISYSVDPTTVKEWLAYQLGIGEKEIIQGKIKI